MPSTFWARTDSSSANNPSLNLTGDPAIEIGFTPSGANGDILLEYNGGAPDPDTQIVIDGQSYDFVFEFSGTLPTQKNQGAQQVPDQFEGDPVFVVTVQDYPSPGETTRLTFLPESNATQAEMDAFGNGAIDVQNIDTTTPGVVCFAAGTRLATPEGERPVEELKAGDLVTTLDAGPMPVIWISCTEYRWPGSDEDARPVLVAAGALGAGRPARDLVISPLHKVLLTRPDAGAEPGPSDVLVPAKGLTGLPGIRRMNGKRQIRYFHVMTERHAILISDGLPSESFYPGPMAMRILRPNQRRELFDRVPSLREQDLESYGPPARPCLSYGETLRLAGHLKSDMKRRALAGAASS